MKRYGNLWSEVIAFENLLRSARKAQRGKRFNPKVLAFNDNLEQELFTLEAELATKTYQPGGYHTFKIQDPKPRLISAAPYRDRVVHHALCAVIAPIFEATFIPDSYANRLGLGTHRALQRFTQFARSHRYVLQCDIRKYFPSIDHEILKTLIRRKIKCAETLWLIDRIIDNSNEQEPAIFHFPGDDLLNPLERRRGLPIGNLTSQFFANVYLNGFDHFVKQQLRVRHYVRYMDDFALFSDDHDELASARLAIEDYLAGLRLVIHPIKSQLFATDKGATFVGFRVLPHSIRVRSTSLERARKRIKAMQWAFATGGLTAAEVNQALRSWCAHLAHGDTWQLRQRIFTSLVFTRSLGNAQTIGRGKGVKRGTGVFGCGVVRGTTTL